MGMTVKDAKEIVDNTDKKDNSTKPDMDQRKIINQLRQEIKNLSKTVKEIQKGPDIQAINIAIPKGLLSRANAYEKRITI
jgi:hypothetical protein